MCPRGNIPTYQDSHRWWELRNKGWSDERIAADEVQRGYRYDIDPRTIAKYIKQYEEDKPQEHSLRGVRHINELLDYSDKVRKCLYDPRSYLIPEYITDSSFKKLDLGRIPLTIERQSYILDPYTWFYLCTPNFLHGHWGGELEQLKAHIKEGSNFFASYKILNDLANTLQADYEQVSEKLSTKNIDFKEKWTKIQQFHKTHRPPLRVKDHAELELEIYPSFSDWRNDLLLVYELETFIPDIFNRLVTLEQLLEKLNDDFSSYKIDSLIQNSHCKDCP